MGLAAGFGSKVGPEEALDLAPHQFFEQVLEAGPRLDHEKQECPVQVVVARFVRPLIHGQHTTRPKMALLDLGKGARAAIQSEFPKPVELLA